MLVAERGETERWAIQCCILREGRNCAVGDTVLCAERGEKLSGGRYSVVCRERGEIERWAIQFCVLKGEKLSGGRYSLLC